MTTKPGEYLLETEVGKSRLFRYLKFLTIIVTFVLAGRSVFGVIPDTSATLTRIALGSCARQNLPQPIWDPIVASKPDLFIFLGDNIYGDSEDMDVMRRKYAQLAAKPGFQKLRQTVPILATWDDPLIRLQIRDDAGEVSLQRKVHLSELQPK